MPGGEFVVWPDLGEFSTFEAGGARGLGAAVMAVMTLPATRGTGK